MIERILVAVDDSAPALAAGAFAIDLALELSAQLHVVTVAEEGRAPDAILRHMSAAAAAVGVEPTITAVRDGTHPFEALLHTADEWQADLIVMGRSDVRRTGRPYVGSQTEHLLEFSAVPVVVVPEAPAGR